MPQSKETDWKQDKKTKPISVLKPGNPSYMQDTQRLKIKGQRKIYQTNGEQKKKAEVAILVSDKIDFKPTKIKRDKEGHYLMVKGSMQQEELTILNIYAPNTGAPRYIKASS